MWEAAVNFVRMMIRRVKHLVPRSKGSRRWSKALFFLFVCFTIIVLIFTLQLYFSCRKIVDAHLKTDRWSLPSTIYADAPMLYEGMPLKQAWLVEYLQRLNYQKTEDVSPDTAQYAVLKNGIAFHKRALFKTQSAIPPVLVQFDNDGISKIINISGKDELAAFELEPAAISNLFGSEWEKRTMIQFNNLPKHLT